MATKQKIDKPVDTNTGVVIYTDGGCRATFGGAGYHGYVYSDQKPTKGSGCTNQYLTNSGYVPKSEVADKSSINEIKPTLYLNGYTSFSTPITNNIAEIAAATAGLDYAVRNDLKYAIVLTDSEMVVKGATTWLNTWKNNNWTKTDGLPVANQEYWLQLDKNITDLKNKGAKVTFKWVKGHSTHFGNQLADKLATIGVLSSKEGIHHTELNIEKAEGYWSSEVDRHPMITQKRIYFTTRTQGLNPGEYFLGDHVSDEDLIGKRSADACYSYVVLKTPEPVIELFRNKQAKLASGMDVIIMGRLDKLYDQNVYKDLMQYGDIVLHCPNKYKLDLNYVDEEPVSKELRPPKLAMRAIESVNTLKGVLLAHQSGNDNKLIPTEITKLIYDIDEKGIYKLKPEFIVGFSSMPIEVNYGVVGIINKEKIDLCLSVDIPERNYLKRLEKTKPVITVVTWMESDKMFRYATIIVSGEDVGIWAGMHSNTRFII